MGNEMHEVQRTGSGNTLEDAIRDAIQTYFLDCIQRNVPATSEGVFTAIAFAVNTYLGRESNEGEKAARRKVAVDVIRFAMRAGPGLTLKEVDKVIQEAQG